MSVFCCCCPSAEAKRFINEPTSNTPLLNPDRKSGEAVINQTTQVPVTTSRGYYRSSSSNDENRAAKKEGGRPRKISISFTNVKAVDKRLQDHKKLYNEYYQCFEDLLQCNGQLCEVEPNTEPNTDHNTGTDTATMENTFARLAKITKHCKSIRIVTSDQNGGTKIEFSAQEIPPDAVTMFTTFNQAHKCIRDLLEKGDKLIGSVQLLLKDDVTLRRDVLSASMGVEGPDCMRACLGGINELCKVPGFIEDIMKRAKKIQKRAHKATKRLTLESDVSSATGSDDVIAHVHSRATDGSKPKTNDNSLIVDVQINGAELKTKVKMTSAENGSRSGSAKSSEVKYEVNVETENGVKVEADMPREQVPAVDYQAPASDEQAPACDEQAPAIAEQSPASDEKTPATDEQAPAIDEQEPASDEQTPATDEQAPEEQAPI